MLRLSLIKWNASTSVLSICSRSWMLQLGPDQVECQHTVLSICSRSLTLRLVLIEKRCTHGSATPVETGVPWYEKPPPEAGASEIDPKNASPLGY